MKTGQGDQHTIIPKGASVVVARNTCVPRNADTEHVLALMGRALTRFEIRADSSIVLEFDPHGAITIAPQFGCDIRASLAADAPKPAGSG